MRLAQLALDQLEAWATAVVLAVAHVTYPLRRRRRARHRRRAFRFSPQDRPGSSTPIGYQVARPAEQPFTGLMQVIASAASAPEFVNPPPRESVFAGVMGPTVPGVQDLPPLSAEAREELAAMHARARRDEVFKARVRAQEQLNKSLAKYGDRYRYRQ